jgi:hypothetical protein
VYVIVTRGKKPSSGFDLTVDRLAISEEGGKTCLIVYSNFTDPEQDTVISQIITYPVEVVKTDLRKLPDEIELRIGY